MSMEHQSAVLLRRINPYCSCTLEVAATLCQIRVHTHITTEHLTLGRDDEERIVLEFDREGE
ncbi:hypothetical protein EHJ14_18135 [Cronobacter sakazakii]|nr:hypothetical protein [Cronobacter sakazakii]PQY64546.1 hypothetical protein C5942_09265 [Cronobacter sakazakii]